MSEEKILLGERLTGAQGETLCPHCGGEMRLSGSDFVCNKDVRSNNCGGRISVASHNALSVKREDYLDTSYPWSIKVGDGPVTFAEDVCFRGGTVQVMGQTAAPDEESNGYVTVYSISAHGPVVLIRTPEIDDEQSRRTGLIAFP